MKEIAKMLKSLGPNYKLTWEWSYFHCMPTLRMTLTYINNSTQMKFQYTQEFPEGAFGIDENYASQILHQMEQGIQNKRQEYWRNV